MYCTKKDICDKDIGIDWYKPERRDPEYIDNWVESFDLLCKSNLMVGLMMATFFIGVTLAMVVVPYLADQNGKKNVFLFSLFVSILGQAGLLFLT